MIKCAAVLLILAVVTTHSVFGKNLPSFLTACKRNDPNVNKCFLTFMSTILKRSSNGIPEMKIPPMEPFIIPKIVLDQGSSRAVTLKAILNNIVVYGMSLADFKTTKVMFGGKPHFELTYNIPTVKIDAKYLMDGKLLIVPIKGSGKCNMSLTNVSGVTKLYTKIVQKKGRSHLDIAKRDVLVNIKGGRFYFDNLFNGNKQLGDTTNNFINDNWQEIYKELRPVIADAVGSVIEYVVKIVLNGFTYNEIFPEK